MGGVSDRRVREIARASVVDECIAVVESEEELNGPIPDVLLHMPIEDALRAAVRATKKSIALRMRDLSTEQQ